MWARVAWYLGREDSLEEGMATHSGILAWRIPWTEEPTGLHGLGHNWTTFAFIAVSFYLERFSSVRFSPVRPFATSWTAACQASLSITNYQSLLKLMSIESVMPTQPSHSLSFPSPDFNLSQHQGLFKWVSSLHQVAKVLEFQVQQQSVRWIFRTDFL